MRRISSILLLAALLLPICSCAEQGPVEGIDPVVLRRGSGSSIYSIESIEDIAFEEALMDIVVARACTPGEYEEMAEGEILTGVGPATLDMRIHGAVMEYEVEEVLRGDAELAGTKIRVFERLIPVESGSRELRAPLCAEPGAEHAVLCLAESSDGTIFFNQIAEYFLMPIA